jgi:hypothetical protein
MYQISVYLISPKYAKTVYSYSKPINIGGFSNRFLSSPKVGKLPEKS